MNKSIILPFSFDATGGISSTTDPAKIWQDRVIIAVMTGLKERVMRPTYGSDVHSTIGENLSDAMEVIRQSVSVTFSRWLTDLTLMTVTGFVDEYDGYLVIEIKYNYRDNNQPQSVNIKTAVLSRSGEVLLEVSKHD